MAPTSLPQGPLAKGALTFRLLVRITRLVIGTHKVSRTIRSKPICSSASMPRTLSTRLILRTLELGVFRRSVSQCNPIVNRTGTIQIELLKQSVKYHLRATKNVFIT